VDEAITEFLACHILGRRSTDGYATDANTFFFMKDNASEADYAAFVSTLVESKLQGSIQPLFHFFEDSGATSEALSHFQTNLHGEPTAAELREARQRVWDDLTNLDISRFAMNFIR
jgi:hypothetical protein